jgi:hypothetical protein
MEWELRKAILDLFHRWQWIILVFLAGALIGYGVSLLLPVQYRAEADLGVFYQSDAIFRNVDDYKNWEMEQLQAVIFSDDILSLTQTELAKMDPFWVDKKPADIRSMLHVYWRNAGVWHLVATAPKPAYARQLVESWKKIILQHIGGALQDSAEWLRVNAELQMASRQKLEMETRQLELTQIQQAFTSWLNEHHPAEQSVEVRQHWRFYELAARLAASSTADTALLGQFPAPDSPVSAYVTWMEKALAAIEVERELLQAQLPVVTARVDESWQSLNKLSGSSWGLSAYIRLDALNRDIPAPQPQRSPSLFALIGGWLSLLLAGVMWLARFSAGSKRRE